MKKDIKFNTLRAIKFLTIPTIGLLLFSCSDDDNNPVPVDEEEVITTITVTLSASGAETVTMRSRDLDGDGPNAPVLDVSGALNANSSYSGSIKLLNETVTPADDITLEVAEEDEEHQFFYAVSGAISGVEYDDEDGNGNPVGINFILSTGAAGSGNLQVTLRHEPKKPNNGSLADAGGSTDVTVDFSVIIE